MKKILMALVLMLGLNSMADDIKLWEKSTLNEIVQRGTLRIGMDPGYMPFEMKDKKGNTIGFDVDLAKTMAKAMGVKLEIVPYAYDGIIAGLITKKFDIIASGMTVTQSRNLKINFPSPYISVGQTLIVAKKHKGKSAKDFNNKAYTIVTKLGVTGEYAARRIFKKATIKTFDTEADAVQEVLSGKADVFIYDQPYNTIFFAQKAQGKVIHLDKSLTYEPLAWGVRKGDPDFINWLNNFMKQIKNDGRYNKIYNKWFKSDAWLKKVM